MSIRIFREFLIVRPDGTVDASRILSKECYQAYLTAKKSEHSEAEAKRYRRTLITHLSGVDGRRAFEPLEEEGILQVVRQNKPWPCFPHDMQVGTTFRGKGFHEKQAILANTSDGGAVMPTPKRARQVKHVEEEEEPPPPSPQSNNAVLSFDNNPLLPPPPPLDIHEPDDNKFVFLLANHLVGLTKTFVSLGVECWRSIIGLFRFVILARTKAVNKYVPEGFAAQLCERTSLAHGNTSAVTIMDLTHKEFDQRIRAQNQVSKDYFGDMVDNLNGMWMRYPDLFQVAVALGTCYSSPGKQMSVQQTYSVRGTLMLFETSYVVDVESFLLICVSVPVK